MPTGLVGRDFERSRLATLMAGAQESSSSVLVWGEAGIGKTRLVEDLASSAERAGARVMRGNGSPLSADVPYAPIQAAVSAALRERSREGVPAVAPSRTEWYARIDEEVSAHGPAAGTLVVVEDVHWADAASLGYLAHLTRNLPATGLVLVMTYRDEGADDLHEAWLGEQLRCPAVTSINLSGLVAEDTVELVLIIDPGLTVGQARAVHQRSGGNPYLATELAQSAAGVEMTGTLRQVLRRRLKDIGPAATRVVAAAGVIARPTTDAELATAVGDEAAVRTAHDERLLEAVPLDMTHCRARHPVIAELAYESLLPEERRGIHARLARSFETSLMADAAAAEVAEVAEHHLRAGHLEDSLVWAVRAAEAAERECAFAEAGRWYSVAVDGWLRAPAVTGLVPARELLVESAGRNLGVAGRHEAVIEVLGRFLDSPQDEQPVTTGAALLVHRSWARFVQGDTDGARDDLARAFVEAEQHGDGDSVKADIHAQVAMIEGTCSRWDVAEEAAREADRLGLASGNRRAQGRAAVVRGVAALMVQGHTDLGLELIHRGLDTAWELGEPDDYSLAAVCLQTHHLESCDPRSAEAVSRQLRHRLRQLAPDGHWMDGMMRANHMQARMGTGDWDGALAISKEAPDTVGFSEIELCVLQARRGELADARASRDRCRDLDRRDQPQFFVACREIGAILALHEGEPRRAVAEATLAGEVCAEHPELARASPRCMLTGMRASALLADESSFDRLVELMGGTALEAGPVPVAAQVAAERSTVRGSRDPDLWDRCARAWTAVGMPYEAAVAQVRLAEAQLGTVGGRRAAAGALTAALAAARRLGAAPLEAEVTTLARTARLRIEQPTEDTAGAHEDADGLTERETQVLELVADGRTNREIGQLLYMSPKTASVHVTHILRKLGVSTRVQAVSAAARRGLLGPVADQQPAGPSRRGSPRG